MQWDHAASSMQRKWTHASWTRQRKKVLVMRGKTAKRIRGAQESSLLTCTHTQAPCLIFVFQIRVLSVLGLSNGWIEGIEFRAKQAR